MQSTKISEGYFVIELTNRKKYLIQTLPFKLYYLPSRLTHKELNSIVNDLKLKKDTSCQVNDFNGYYGLDVVLTTNCNLRCVYCCALSSKIEGYYGLKPMNMDIQTANKVINLVIASFKQELLKKPIKHARFDLFFTGGEPLINFNVLEFMLKKFKQELKTLGNSLNLQIEFSPEVASNAILITEKIAKTLKKYRVQVAVTLDGPWHDVRRIYPNKEGSSKQVLRGLKILITNQNMIKLQSVVSLDNMVQVDKIFQYYNEHKLLDKIKTVHIIPQAASIFDRYLAQKKTNLSSQDIRLYKEYGKVIYALSKQYNLDVKNYQERLFRSIRVGGLLHRCAAGLWKFAVTPSGALYPCHQLINIKEFYMGNVYDKTPLNGTASKVRDLFKKRTVFKVEPCADCVFQTVCIPFVDCPARCYLETGNLYKVSEHYCRIHKPYMEELFAEFISS